MLEMLYILTPSRNSLYFALFQSRHSLLLLVFRYGSFTIIQSLYSALLYRMFGLVWYCYIQGIILKIAIRITTLYFWLQAAYSRKGYTYIVAVAVTIVLLILINIYKGQLIYINLPRHQHLTSGCVCFNL